MNIGNIFSRLDNRQKRELNKKIAEIFSSKFGDKFGKFLFKRLRKQFNKKIDILALFKEISVHKNDEAYDKLYDIIEAHLLDYLEKRVTSYFYNRISGDKRIDSIFKKVVITELNRIDNRQKIKENIGKKVTGKIDDIIEDLKKEKILFEAQDTLSWAQKLKSLGSKQKRYRYQALNKVFQYLPSVNSKIKREVKSRVFTAKFTTIEAILENEVSGRRLANLIDGPIFNHMLRSFFNTLKKEDDIVEDISYTILKILNEKELKDDARNLFNAELEDYLESVIYIKKKENK